MILEWHLFLRLLLRFVRKILSFVGKYLAKYLPKRCLLIFCIFLFKWRGVNPTICLIKYIENTISNSTSHKTKNKREKQKRDPTSKSAFLKLLKELSLITLITIYDKLVLLSLSSDPDKNLNNKNQCRILNLVIVTSNKLYFHSFHETNVQQISTEN